MEDMFQARAVTCDDVVYKYRVFVPRRGSVGKRVPIVVFLHGTGEWGTDNRSQTQHGLGKTLRALSHEFPACVLFPQAPEDEVWGGPMAAVVMRQLDETIEELGCDRERVYVTGLSLGGDGSWELPIAYPDRFAATVPVAGEIVLDAGSPLDAFVTPTATDPYAMLAARIRHIPAWIFHGEKDPVSPVASAQRMANALREAGGSVRLTVYAGAKHHVWDRAYADPELWRWLFAIKRSA